MGTASAKEVVIAVEKAAIDAKRHVIGIPITKGYSFPHRVNGVAGGAKVMLRPASEGTGTLPTFSKVAGLKLLELSLESRPGWNKCHREKSHSAQ